MAQHVFHFFHFIRKVTVGFYNFLNISFRVQNLTIQITIPHIISLNIDNICFLLFINTTNHFQTNNHNDKPHFHFCYFTNENMDYSNVLNILDLALVLH
jgi:hypothetical protein